MTFGEALKILNIEDYSERIFNSNSHGELLHLADYGVLAEHVDDPVAFRKWFVKVVEHAEQEWNRPESIFQHILKIVCHNKEEQ
jgi:hypothetical protein